MPQTDYSLYQDKGFEGEIITTEPSVVRSGYNAGNVKIPFGRILVKGSESDTACVLPSATGQLVMGVSTKTDLYEKGSNGVAGYDVDKPLNRLIDGVVLMRVEQNVTPASAVFFRHTPNTSPGVNEAVGRLRTNADTDKADALPNVRFLETGVAGSLVKVAFDLI